MRLKYTSTLLTYILPLLIGLISIVLLKESIGNSFPYNYMIPKSIMLISIGLISYVILKREEYPLAISLLSTSLLISSIWAMFGTQTILGGFGGDNSFSMVMVANFMHSNSSSDVTYRGLSSFYPFYFYYGVAKMANLFDLTLYKALKYGVFITIYFMPIATYYLWKNIYSPQKSFMMVLSTLFILSISIFFRKTYELISLVLIVPWWIYYFNISRLPKEAVVGGLIGGLLFGTFYYWFFPLVLASIWIIIGGFREFVEHIRYYGLFLLSFLLSSSFYLFPYINDLLIYGSEPFQNRYFTAQLLHIPLESITSLRDFLLFCGFAYLILFRKGLVERYILIILISSYIWILLGHIGIIMDTPLLVNKLNIFIYLLLSFGFGLLLYEGGRYVDRGSLIVVALILMTTALFTQISDLYSSKELKSAKEFKLDSRWSDQKSISLLKDSNILADRSRMFSSSTHNIHFFTTWSSCYTHPASRLSQRIIFLHLLSQSSNPNFISWILRHNRFDPIEFVWLKDNRYNLLHTNFPKANPYNKISIEFKPIFFGSLKRVEGYNELYRVVDSDIKIDSLDRIDRVIYDYFATDGRYSREILDLSIYSL
jgi:hypothetical protein